MKFVKGLLSLLLVFSLVACSNTEDKKNTFDHVAYTTLMTECGANGMKAAYNTFVQDGNTEWLYSDMSKIDGTYYEGIQTAVAAIEFVEGGTTGNAIARVVLQKGADIVYLYVYDNGTVSVRKDNDEMVYTVNQSAIDALVTEITNAYVAYEAFRAGK